MRRMSDKKLAEIQETACERFAFKLEHSECMVCRGQTCDCHEIARGGVRSKSVRDRCSWLSLCRTCHESMGDQSTWTIARQLALKALRDPGHYDRQRVNLLRGEQPDAISELEVWQELPWVLRRVRWGGMR